MLSIWEFWIFDFGFWIEEKNVLDRWFVAVPGTASIQNPKRSLNSGALGTKPAVAPFLNRNPKFLLNPKFKMPSIQNPKSKIQNLRTSP